MDMWCKWQNGGLPHIWVSEDADEQISLSWMSNEPLKFRILLDVVTRGCSLAKNNYSIANRRGMVLEKEQTEHIAKSGLTLRPSESIFRFSGYAYHTDHRCQIRLWHKISSTGNGWVMYVCLPCFPFEIRKSTMVQILSMSIGVKESPASQPTKYGAL